MIFFWQKLIIVLFDYVMIIPKWKKNFQHVLYISNGIFEVSDIKAVFSRGAQSITGIQ